MSDTPLQWKQSYHKRVRLRFPIDGVTCEHCREAPARDHHHIDGDVSNNIRDNIALLCRRCHMIADGRLESLREMGSQERPISPFRPCINCGQLYKPLRRGRCNACSKHWSIYGEERPSRLWEKTHCKNGHEYLPETTGFGINGRRICLICRRRAGREYYHRRRETLSKVFTCDPCECGGNPNCPRCNP